MSCERRADVARKRADPGGGLRDGLQIQAPVPTAGKLELLGALVSAGARRIEATAFVSPRAVPALADAEKVAKRLGDLPGMDFSALVANVRGAERAVAAGISALEYVVSAADSHSSPTPGSPLARRCSAWR